MNRTEAESAAATFRRCRWDVWAKPDKVGGFILFARPAGGGDRLLYGFSHNDMKVLVISGQVASLKFAEGDRVKRADADTSNVPAYCTMEGTVVGFVWTRVLVKWDMDGGKVSSHLREDLRLV